MSEVARTGILAAGCLMALCFGYGQQTFQPTESLEVGVLESPPFAIRTDEGWQGIGVELWQSAAQEMNVVHDWRALEPEGWEAALDSGEVDLVIGATASASRQRKMDFTSSYLVSSIGFAESSQRRLGEIFSAFFSPRFWRIALWLSVAFILVGLLAWLLERKANEEQFGGKAIGGVWSGFWWAGVTMSTIGYGDKAPRSVGGRILALLWMLVAMGITAALTASLTSVLTSESGFAGTQFPDDFRRMTVGAVAESQSAALLDGERIRYQPFETVEGGMKAVNEGELDAFLADSASLRFVNSESIAGALRVTDTGIFPQHHSFALPEESRWREELDQIILDRIEEPAWRDRVERYLPSN